MSRNDLAQVIGVSVRAIQWWAETGLLVRRDESRLEWVALIALLRDRAVPLVWIRRYVRRLVDPAGAFLLIDGARPPRWFDTAAALISAATAAPGAVVIVSREQVQARAARKKRGGHYGRRRVS